jgi:hypothetical protein
MALIDSYTPTTNNNQFCTGTKKLAMTFTATANYTIRSLTLKLYKSGSPGPTLLTVSIYATSGGIPTTSLCSGTTDASTLPTSSPYEDRLISLGVGVDLTLGTKYAIVLSADAANVHCRTRQAVDYSGGELYQNPSGTWIIYSPEENAWFETWDTGIPYALETLVSTGTGVASLTIDNQTMIEETKIVSAIGSSGVTDSQGYYELLLFVVGEGHTLLTSETYAAWYWGIQKSNNDNVNKNYDEVTQTWIAANGKGGGRFKTSILVIAHDNSSNNGVLLFNVD